MKNILIIIILFTYSCGNSSYNSDKIIPIITTKNSPSNKIFKNSKYGYALDGEVLISPQYNYAYGFEKESKLAVVENATTNLYGYINPEGEYVIKPIYDRADIHTSSERLARVQVGKEWGFIDTEGNVIIPIKYEFVGKFSEGLTPVKFGNKYGYINEKGVLVIQPHFDLWNLQDIYIFEIYNLSRIGRDLFHSYEFNNNRAIIRINNRFGFINKTGKIVIEPKFELVTPFSDGKAKVAICTNCGDKELIKSLNRELKYITEKELLWGIIDINGDYIIEPKYIDIEINSEEIFPVVSQDLISKPSFSKTINGVTHVNLTTNYIFKLGFMNYDGDWIITPQFEYNRGISKSYSSQYDNIKKYIFSEGLAFVCKNGKCGYIDKSGEFKIEKNFYRTGKNTANEFFSGGLAAVSINDNPNKSLSISENRVTGEKTIKQQNLNYIGFIDKTGKFVIPPKFQTVTPFKNGYSMVTNFQDCVINESCYINKKGDYIWYDEFSKYDIKVIK